MATPLSITDKEFEQAVLKANTPVLVDFWAPWCASCRMVAPVVDELAAEYASRIAVVKVNVEDNLEYARRYDVRQTPTILLFRNGEEVDRIIGAGKKPLYTAKLDTLLAD